MGYTDDAVVGAMIRPTGGTRGDATDCATILRIRGVVQGVGFRPFVLRLADTHRLAGWVRNDAGGVEIHVEGTRAAVAAFSRDLHQCAPAAAAISEVETSAVPPSGYERFEILESERSAHPTARISPDLPTCEECLADLNDPSSRRHGHPYISCSHCGPRYSIITALPYDRARTTMVSWSLCGMCGREYGDPADRRFHAQPIACLHCGPHYSLVGGGVILARDLEACRETARWLAEGRIVAIKGVGGYHLACDARNTAAVAALRDRKYRKEKPFAVMAADLDTAHRLVVLTSVAEDLLVSPARPIVLAPARMHLPLVAPDSRELGVMLPSSPIQHLLFDCGAPALLVMTSGNRSSEPTAYEDDDAFDRLAGIADAFLIGERPIARRVDDSVARAGTLGPQLLRRSRGYAPSSAAHIPLAFPALGLGADLKNAVTLVVDGEAFVSQHIGDLGEARAASAFEHTVRDLITMYDVDIEGLRVAHDLHPQFASTQYANALPAYECIPVQHHRAHVASVLAERGAFDTRVLGIAFDGTGYGDDGAIWGGEFFAGSIAAGLERVAHLRPAILPGGDAAARSPVQAAAGYLVQLDIVTDLTDPPFSLPKRFRQAQRLISADTRVFPTTSVGRLFDTVAALLGFTRDVTYEAQAAMWLEQLAGRGRARSGAVVTFAHGELDFRPALAAVVEARLTGTPREEIARRFHFDLARGIADAAAALCDEHQLRVIVLSGGVFQNELLVRDVCELLSGRSLELWMNRLVPPNDGGISLGQTALLLR